MWANIEGWPQGKPPWGHPLLARWIIYAILATFQSWYRIDLIHEFIFKLYVMFEEVSDLIWFDLSSTHEL